MKKSKISRRRFIGTSGLATMGLITAGNAVIGAPSIIRSTESSGSMVKGVRIGVITYSFRSMPDQSAEATLQYVKDCGINHIELMGDPAETYAGKPENPVDFRTAWPLFRKARSGEELSKDEEKELEEIRAQMDAYNKEVAEWRNSVSMDKFKEVKKMYSDAGVSIYAFKPNAFGMNNSEAEINYGFRAAKTLGASHVTLELPGNDAHTKKLGEMAAKHKMYIGYHGHEQQTPTWWDMALSQSRFNAMNLDLGHYVAAGNPDPLILIRDKHDRIASMHIKDRQTPENGKGNLPFGEGDTPIVETLNLMSIQKYKFPATIELEYEIPEGSNAVAEVKKCLEYCRNALES